jgi:hypothetical protein
MPTNDSLASNVPGRRRRVYSRARVTNYTGPERRGGNRAPGTWSRWRRWRTFYRDARSAGFGILKSCRIAYRSL